MNRRRSHPFLERHPQAGGAASGKTPGKTPGNTAPSPQQQQPGRTQTTPGSAPSRRKSKPGWDDTINDLSKLKLTPTEVKLKRNVYEKFQSPSTFFHAGDVAEGQRRIPNNSGSDDENETWPDENSEARGNVMTRKQLWESDTPVRIRRPYQSKSTENTPNAALPGDEPDAAKERWLQQKNGAVKETRSPVAVAAPLDGQDQTVTTLPTTIPVTPLQRNSTLAAHFVETPREIDIDSEIRQFEKHATPATLVRSSSASAPSSLRHPPRAKQQQQQHMMTPSMKRIVSSVRGETTLDGDDDSERQLQAACHRLLRALDNEHSDTTMASGGWMEVLVSAMNALADDAVLRELRRESERELQKETADQLQALRIDLLAMDKRLNQADQERAATRSLLSELEIVSERVQEELGDINGKLAMLTRDRAQAHISKSVAALIHMGLGDGNEHVSCTNARPSVAEQQSEDTGIQRKSPKRVMFQLPEEAERQRAPKEAETHHQHWVSLDSDGDEDE